MLNLNLLRSHYYLNSVIKITFQKSRMENASENMFFARTSLAHLTIPEKHSLRDDSGRPRRRRMDS